MRASISSRRDQVEARNRADAMIYNTEKTLSEHRAKISDEDAKTIEAALETAKKAMKDGDAKEIDAAVQNLTTASHKLAEAMYKASATPGGTGGQSSEPQGGGPGADEKKDDVVDAEFVDVDDKSKGS